MSHVIRNGHTETLIGVALVVVGAYLVYDAHEGRGRRRPFALRFLPGG